MECIKCKHENPSEARFCMKCGTKFERVCPKCDIGYTKEPSFCMKCGEKLLDIEFPQISASVKKQYNAENRPVTVLFVDISGSTELSIRESSEHIYELTDECFIAMDEIIAAYEGSSGGFRGDGLVGLFGAPKLYEDFAERAIFAAIDIRDFMRSKGLETHMGINTAFLTVGEVKTFLHRERSAYGKETIIARRLQESAGPGQILVSSETYQITRSAFDFEVLPPLKVRGFTDLVTAYSVIRARIHPEKSRGIELGIEFIGRKRELNDIKECVDNLLSGKGRVVSIIGEAGIGKSRLAIELKKYIKDMEIMCLEGRGSSVRESTAYWIFIDMLKSYFGFTEDDTSSEMAGKIINRMQLLSLQTWEETVPYIGNLLSVKFGNEWDEVVRYLSPEQVRFQTDQIRYKTSWILRDLFVSLAKQKPLLLIFDDLHWADNPSLDLLSLMMDDIHSVPIMLLCIYRPPEREYRKWHVGIEASGKCRDRYKEIVLHELIPQESIMLVESLESSLRIGSLPEKLRTDILEKAGGNPLFIEEIVHSLIDNEVIYWEDNKWNVKDSIDHIELPSTIQNVIITRIDILDDEIRSVIQYASVIGTVFQYKLLQYCAQEQKLDEYLWQLEEKDLIYRDRAIPETEFRFKHVWIQETLYNRIFSSQRQDLHFMVGEGIEKIYHDRIEEFYGELSRHYSQCGHLPKAIDYSVKAGNKAKVVHAYTEAIYYFKSAIGLMESQSQNDEQLQLEISAREALGDIFFTTGTHHEAEVQLECALNMASKIQDIYRAAEITSKLADLVHWQGDFVGAIKIAESGLKTLGDQTHNPEAVSLLEILSRSYRAKYGNEKAYYYADQIAEMLHEIPYFDSIYKAYYEVAFLEMEKGNNNSAREWLNDMEKLCIEKKDEVGLARCYHGMSELFLWDDLLQANQWLEKSLSLCEKVGEKHLLMEGHFEMAWLLIRLHGDQNQIESHFQQGIETAKQMAKSSNVASAPELCRLIGEAYMETGNKDKALMCYHLATEFVSGDSNGQPN